jgi:hypothetical protein
MRIKLSDLSAKVRDRPSGYLHDCLTHGTVKGRWIEFTDNAWRTLCRRYRPSDPSREEMAEDYRAATMAHAARGFEIVSEQIYKARLMVCDMCDREYCESCGAKRPRLYWKWAKCPEGKWQ